MIEAVGNNILVKAVERENTRKGIIVPQAKREYDLVEVVSSGSDEFICGEKVFTFLHCGNEIIYDDKKYYFIDKQFVHGRLL